ncbi:unnamed protein product [Symbiodinium sp. CCMP2456]|nr:unnamed protein product [Symbiodinium sp. CCMP2456]
MAAPRRCDMNQPMMLGRRTMDPFGWMFSATAIGKDAWIWNRHHRGKKDSSREPSFATWTLQGSTSKVQYKQESLAEKGKGHGKPGELPDQAPKNCNEVAQALPSLAMVDPNLVAATSALERHSVKLAGEPAATMLLGLMTWLVLLWFVCRRATGCCSRALQWWPRSRQPEVEPEEETEATPLTEEPPAGLATPPTAVVDLFRTPARARQPQDLRPPAPEPEPHDGDAGSAAAAQPAQSAATPPAAAPPQNYNVEILRARRRPQQPGPRLPPAPQHNFAEMDYAPHTMHGSPLQELCGTSLSTTQGHHHRKSLPHLLGRDDHRNEARG